MNNGTLIQLLTNLRNGIHQTVVMNTFMINPQHMYYQLNMAYQEIDKIINYTNSSEDNIENLAEQTEPNYPSDLELLLGSTYSKWKEYQNDEDKSNIVAMSIDIRKSTFYLENSKQARYFVKLLEEINNVIINSVNKHCGIIDKFTGDGFIVFFPKFFTGDKYLLLSLLCATEIIQEVQKVFNSNEEYYYKYPNATEIGIGLDVGNADLLKVNNKVTYIGRCVVNACRICGYSTNEVLGNSLMKAEINKSGEIELNECESRGIPYKDNPEIKVYSIIINNAFDSSYLPQWSLTPASTWYCICGNAV